ncbi:MAG TPA: hypothetical protein VGJ90_01060 [Methylophilaceae bacterium]|jgi:ElaB/YqjD/DUF883 family membrane-anchored ribosome-binding protein
MFNLSKSNDVSEKAVEVVENVKDNLQDLAGEAKGRATDLSDKLKKTATDAKVDAAQLLESIRQLIEEKTETQTNKVSAITATLYDQYEQLSATAKEELYELVAKSQVKTKKVLNEQPLLTLAVAVGAGALIGYVIGQSKASSQD